MNTKSSQILLAFFIVLIIGLCIGMDIQQTIDKSNITQPDKFIFITYTEPLGPPIKGVIVTNIPKVEPFIISSITPCSEPYYINYTLLKGDWVQTTSGYTKHYNRQQLHGQIIEVDNDILTICTGKENNIIYKNWVEPWDCTLIMYNPDIGYFCSTELMSVPYNENTTYVTKIYAD